MNTSLPTVILGMIQETDLFEQSSISICSHTTMCYDPINYHKQKQLCGTGCLPPCAYMQPPRFTQNGDMGAVGRSHLLSNSGRVQELEAVFCSKQNYGPEYSLKTLPLLRLRESISSALHKQKRKLKWCIP